MEEKDKEKGEEYVSTSYPYNSQYNPYEKEKKKKHWAMMEDPHADIRPGSNCWTDDSEEEKARQKKENIGCAIIAISLTMFVVVSVVLCLLHIRVNMFLLGFITFIIGGIGILVMGKPKKDYSYSGGSSLSWWLTPPKNPRWLRRRIRHRLGW